MVSAVQTLHNGPRNRNCNVASSRALAMVVNDGSMSSCIYICMCECIVYMCMGVCRRVFIIGVYTHINTYPTYQHIFYLHIHTSDRIPPLEVGWEDRVADFNTA